MFGPSLGDAIGLGMRFEEQAVGADGHRRAGQRLDHRAIAAGRRPQAARLLHAMGGVEDHRARPATAFAEWTACR